MGTRLLYSLEKSVGQSGMTVNQKCVWNDSTIVLCWLAKKPSRWSAFISNRVSEIQGESSVTCKRVCWKKTHENSASGSVPPDQFWNNSLWWKGPKGQTIRELPQAFQPTATSEELKKSEVN